MPTSSTTSRRSRPLLQTFAFNTDRWTNRLYRPFALFAAIALLLGAIGSPAQAAAVESRVLPQLQQQAAKNPTAIYRVIVTRINAKGNERKENDADKHVGRAGGKKLKNMPHDAFVAELPGRAIKALGQNPNVKFVAPDADVVSTCADGCNPIDPSKLANMYPQAIGASGLWPSSFNGTGWTGKGVGVAVLDTGVNPARADWKDAAGNSRIIADAHFSPSIERKADGHGHGTHVAGIVAANSWHRTDSLRGKYVGVAPEANIIDVKVSDDRGRSYISDVVYAIDWVVANRQTYNIRVMNLSLVSSVAESATTSTLSAAVERAWFNGILVVVASGNTGPNTLRYPPANDPFVITVGANDTADTVQQSDDFMAPWSSYGTTQDGYTKPDVTAPGRRIIAPLALSTATLAKRNPDRIVDQEYIWMSGTSMASPVVAGIAALAFQAHPEWTNDQVKWLLMNTATKLGPLTAPYVGQGAGEVNAASVVNFAGVPLPANQGQPVNQQLNGPDGATTYSSSTWSSSTWSSSTWSSSTWSSSTWSSSTWSSSTWSSSNYSASSDCSLTGECTDVASTDVE